MAEEKQKTDEELAAEWEASMAGGDEAPAAEGGEITDRTLSQAEIDSLLGVAMQGSTAQTGIGILVNSSNISYERLPMLEVVFDRLVRLLTTTLRNFTSDNVDVSLHSIKSIRFGDYLNSIPLPCLISVFKFDAWEASGLLTIDTSLDVLLGGKRGMNMAKIEGRPFTTIERNLVERLIRVVLGDFSKSFHPVAEVNFNFDRLETNPRFATVVRPANAAVLAKIMIEMDDRGGCLEFMLPYSALEPVREQLLQMFMGEKLGQDSIWETHLGDELWETSVTMEAVLEQTTASLNDVLNWKKGSHLPLTAKSHSMVQVQCGDIPAFTGRMGQRNGKVSIQVERNFLKEKKDLLP